MMRLKEEIKLQKSKVKNYLFDKINCALVR